MNKNNTNNTENKLIPLGVQTTRRYLREIADWQLQTILPMVGRTLKQSQSRAFVLQWMGMNVELRATHLDLHHQAQLWFCLCGEAFEQRRIFLYKRIRGYKEQTWEILLTQITRFKQRWSVQYSNRHIRHQSAIEKREANEGLQQQRWAVTSRVTLKWFLFLLREHLLGLIQAWSILWKSLFHGKNSA